MSKFLKKYRGLFLFVLVIIVGASLAAGRGRNAAPAAIVVPEGAKAGDLTDLKKCAYQAKGSKTIFEAECGTLSVPENREAAGSRLIALPVVRIPASGPNPAEPVFWLVGGPGGSNLRWTPPAWILEKHDVVLVGYRGVDGTVKLSCPEVARRLKAHLANDLYTAEARADLVAAAKQCAARHEAAGVDLRGYSIPAVIEDIEAARMALGYDRINLFSESYGTRVAQIYAYMHADSLRRIVQVGVNTPGHFIYFPAQIDGMLRYVSGLCARDAKCSSRTSDLAQTIYTVNRSMPKRWLFFNIDPDTVRLGSQFLLYSDSTMATVFDVYLAAADGDPSGLVMANIMTRLMVPADTWIYGDIFSKGGTADLDKYGGIESISLGNSIMGAPHSELVFPMAAEWPVQLVPQELRDLQQSDVEMLLVNGTLDFSTPPGNMDEAKTYWRNAQMVLLPEFSHVDDVYTLQPDAFERLITSYYDTGEGDTSLYVYQRLSFEPEMNMTMLAKVLAAAAVGVPVALVSGVVLVVRRIRRGRTMQRKAEADESTNTAMNEAGKSQAVAPGATRV